MRINPWLLAGLLGVAFVIGTGGVIASIAVNRYTSTDAFCTSCHTMAMQAEDPYFQHSAHRTNAEGVRPSCGDCHIPRTNWFVETYTHISSGTRDVIAEFTHNFNDPKTWAAHRAVLAQEVRTAMHAQDSVTCRSCHGANAIHPASAAGEQAHALLRQGNVTCVDCHMNLVHPAAQPTAEAK
jgi:trimethylamine-N-oxide reductase (cytochrome c), cytochrome c-type subunit TorY